MPTWIRESRPILDSWIDTNNVDPAAVSRIVDGMDLSEGREPADEVGRPQRPEILIPGLTAVPWWDDARLPWVRQLEAAWPEISAEFAAVRGVGSEYGVRHPNEHNLADAGRWTAYYFYMLGRTYDEHIAACPRTVEALADLDGVRDSGMCYFSVLSPHAHVTPHCGFINARIRCHLALVAPEGARMRVGTEIRPWREGRAVVFDDSFEHEVWNDTDRTRAVLLFDVWHPDLTDVEKALLAHMMPVWKSFLYRDEDL
ncbi:aspartyl/asparaginyl beta-hydroxylase domain-containing protein [Pseudonocardia alni]|uniref:Aspartate beta-hydroxylase n=1 Tax=Pseudonocardia alni TaxID=33907 RepID=A0A852WGK9_PSEA5|nr:aspartyl/asparaginyl beta-hydroxylase domain-containing protein [Pseudonocardia antarctica]NYG05405.1 aspartate beta-hydroxylase [Pseudonocardia antarctica]